MSDEIRFGAFVRMATVRQQVVSFNELVRLRTGTFGYRVRVRPLDVYRLIAPYTSRRMTEQVRAVVPLALYLLLFQVVILRQDIADAGTLAAGLLAVILGLMLFMEGLKVGLMPFGETLGTKLPVHSPLRVVLLVVFLLGIGVTFAEPAIGALKTAGQFVDVTTAPYLYALLNEWSEALVLVVAVGVGLAALLGTLRLLYGWSLKYLIYATLLPLLALTLYLSQNAQLAPVLGLAWDAGAVTTGPVTVPLVLALGVGIAGAAGRGDSSLSGFGIVTLASLFPVIAVQLLALFVASAHSPEEVILAAQSVSAVASAGWMSQSPGAELVGGVRAIVPLVLFLLFVLLVVVKHKPVHPVITAYGIFLCVVGMVTFNLGLTYGLSALGSQAGSLAPAAFSPLDGVAGSPLYAVAVGTSVAIGFAWFLGFGATLAEPALNALGLTVDNLTNGAFRRSTLMYAVSFGVGGGIAIGVARIIYDWPLVWLLVPGYGLALVLTWLSSEEFVNIAWDSAGVTTGPVTVPLVLAMGLGFGEAVGAMDGFGILAMASIGPILSVMSTGLWIDWKIRRRHAANDRELLSAARTVQPGIVP